MNVTEQEAYGLFCPFRGVAMFCVGPRCMAWRWQPLPLRKRVEVACPEAPRPDRVPAGWPLEVEDGEAAYVEPWGPYRGRWTGRCGLAGSVGTDVA